MTNPTPGTLQSPTEHLKAAARALDAAEQSTDNPPDAVFLAIAHTLVALAAGRVTESVPAPSPAPPDVEGDSALLDVASAALTFVRAVHREFPHTPPCSVGADRYDFTARWNEEIDGFTREQVAAVADHFSITYARDGGAGYENQAYWTGTFAGVEVTLIHSARRGGDA